MNRVPYRRPVKDEDDFIFWAISDRTIRSSKNMYPYIILQYKVPMSWNPYERERDHDFEIAMRHDIIGDKRLHCPSLRIAYSSNCEITTNNGERDKPMTRLTRKLLRPNRVTNFKINLRGEGPVVYVGFFGEGVKYIDYLSLLNRIHVKSKYIKECERLENLILSPNCFIDDLDFDDIPKTIQFLKFDSDMYRAKDANVEKLILKEKLQSLYLTGYGYTGKVKTLLGMSNLKNANIIAPNITDIDELKKEDFPTATLFDVGPSWVSIMKA